MCRASLEGRVPRFRRWHVHLEKSEMLIVPHGETQLHVLADRKDVSVGIFEPGDFVACGCSPDA